MSSRPACAPERRTTYRRSGPEGRVRRRVCYWATGHRRGGILLAPITAQLVAGALAGEQPPPYAAAFAPGRFARRVVGSPG